MSSKSNGNGRALEFCFVNEMQTRFPNAILLENTSDFQIRDCKKFQELPINQQKIFITGSQAYLDSNEIISNIIGIKRLPDNAGKKGDITDIRLNLANCQTVNISLKNNHLAMKHQRPGALFEQLGVVDLEQEKNYKHGITEIENNFYLRARIYSTNRFKVIKQNDKSIIDDLYSSVCSLVCSYINHYSFLAEQYFSFLVGNIDFTKIVFRKDFLEISDYNQIGKPAGMIARADKNYIYLDFDNGYHLSMRLHTASGSFKVGSSLSLKFDTSLLNKDILPQRRIEF